MNNTTHLTPSGIDATITAGTHDSMQINQFVLLHDGYAVSKDFLDSVRQQVEATLSALLPDERYRLKDLCGDEFWNQLDDGECRTAGRCMAYMVCSNLLPLSFAESNHEYPKWYRLK